MCHSKNFNFNLLILFFALLFLATTFSACERLANITLVNQRSQEVSVYYTVVLPDGSLEQTTSQGTIPANSTKTQSIILIKDEDIKRIEIKDSLGNLLFSHDYKRADLEKIGWKITIPP